MSNDMYLPSLPAISHDLSVSISLVQLTITMWFAGNTSMQLIIGPLSDRCGRRPVLFVGGILFLLSTLGCALAPSIAFFLVARFIQGVSVCTMMVAGYASVHDLYDDNQAIYILALMGSAAIIAPAVGPLLGGLIMLFGSWRDIFFLLFAIAFFALIALWFNMPESKALCSKETKMDVKGIVRSYWNIICNTAFMTSAGSFGILFGGIIGWITASPFLLINLLKLTPLQFAWIQVPIFGAYILGAQMIKILLERIGKEKLITIGLMIATLSGCSLILLSIFFPDKLVSFILPMMGYSIGFGFVSAPLNRITITATPEEKGTTIAVFYLIMSGSGTLVSFILSSFKETALSISIIIAACIFLSFFLNVMRPLKD